MCATGFDLRNLMFEVRAKPAVGRQARDADDLPHGLVVLVARRWPRLDRDGLNRTLHDLNRVLSGFPRADENQMALQFNAVSV